MSPTEKLAMRKRTVAQVLDCSESQVDKFARAGLLHPIRPFEDLRATWFDPTEVRALAKRLLESNTTESQETCIA